VSKPWVSSSESVIVIEGHAPDSLMSADVCKYCTFGGEPAI